MATKEEELGTIKEALLADKMQELRIRMSNGNTLSYLGQALFTKPEVTQGVKIESYEVYPPQENEEGNMIQGIRVNFQDGRIGEYVGKQLATEEELDQGVSIVRFNLGFPEDITDEIREQVAEDE